MKWLKICLLLILTLAAMRALSWAAAWILQRFTSARAPTVAVLANGVGFIAFFLFLYFNLLPGEPIDWGAVAFGLVVFVIYAAIDILWRPSKRKVRTV